MEQSAKDIFDEKIKFLTVNGLKKFAVSSVVIDEPFLSESFYQEANRLLDAMVNEEGEELFFNDSRRK